MSNKPVQEQVLVRLDHQVYEQLERQCGLAGVNSDTSPIQAGMQLGIERVLRLLRQGFVVTRQ